MTITVAQLISFLQRVEKEHGGDVSVYAADRDYGLLEIYESAITVINHYEHRHMSVVL